MRGRAALCLLALVTLGSAPALPKYRMQAIPQLHYDEGQELWQFDRRVMACSYCHVKDTGGAPWNPFGQAIQAEFQASGGKAKFPQVLHSLLRADRDSDADGYPDALEVFARTLPGDPASRPKESLTELRAAFEASGGTERYAPAAKR